jgi:hypothetical protein
MDDLPPQFQSDPLVQEVKRRIKVGTILAVIGVLLFGIVLGAIAIYYGATARRAAHSLAWRSQQRSANLVIALGAFDIAFSFIMIVGTIRILGAGG